MSHLSNHVIDESVLIPDACLLILLPVVRLIHVCKDLQETAIVDLQNGVLCGQVQRPAQHTSHLDCALLELTPCTTPAWAPACQQMQHGQQMQSTATYQGNSVSNGIGCCKVWLPLDAFVSYT